MPLIHIISLSACAPLWKMARKKVNNLSTNKEFYQFQVAYVSYLYLKQNKSLKDQIDKFLYTKFYGKTSAHTMKKLNMKVPVPLL